MREINELSDEALLSSARDALESDLIDLCYSIVNIMASRPGFDKAVIRELSEEIQYKKANKKFFHVVVNGDSLSLPIAWKYSANPIIDPKLSVKFEETYPFLIESWLRDNTGFERIEVTNLSTYSATIDIVKKRLDLVLHYLNGDVIIQQCGLVDCFYREDNEGKVFQNYNLEEFSEKYKQVLEYKDFTAQPKPYYALSIMPLDSKTRHIETQKIIPEYNKVLSSYDYKNVEYVDLAADLGGDEIDGLLHPDGQHLNKDGHRNAADKIIKLLEIELKGASREQELQLVN